MNQEETLATLKKDVRSLLISSKIGLDPEQLRRDYVNTLGCPMPLKQLGFRNILDMVKEMPDIVSVHFQADGNILLKGVGDEKTENIENLIAKQRYTKKKNTVNSRSPWKFSSHYYQKPPVVFLPRRGRAPQSLPAHLRAQLRILLSQAPILLSDLEACYRCCFGQPLRVQSYGFYSVGEMLNAALDMISIHQGRYGSVLSLRQHMLPRPVLTSFTPKRKPMLVQPGITTNKPSFSEPCDNVKTPTECPASQSSSNGSRIEKSLDPVLSESTCDRKPEVMDRCHKAQALAQHEDVDLRQHIFKLEEELRQQIVENGVTATISQELKDKLRQVVGQTQGGLSVHELPAAYQKLHGEELPLVQSGFVSTTELVGALNDIFHLKPSEDDGGQDWTIIDIHDKNNNNIDTQLDLRESSEFNCDDKPQTESHYLISGESPWETQQESSMDDHDSDQTDLTEDKGLKINHILQITEQYSAIQVHCSPTVPLDALLCQRLKPPTRRPARELAEVLVERIESPGYFYVRLTETEEARDLGNMMIQMRRCYKHPKLSERYRLPEPYIRRGQVCCVSPRGMWFYRVVIHQVIDPTEVEVYYVDYGIMAVTKSAKLIFLKSVYSALPAQAIPSTLAGIAPSTGSWTAEAVASFQTLCSDRTLVGAVVCYIGDVLQLYLCDTHTSIDIYIHSVLQSEGHGVACRPADGAELCTQVTPVTLHMGANTVDLPEVIQAQASSWKQPEGAPHSSAGSNLKDGGDDMPSLEVIDNSIPLTSQEEPGSSQVLQNHPNPNCSEVDSALTRDPVPTSSPSVSLTPVGPSDLSPSTISPVHGASDDKQSPTPPQTPDRPHSSSACQTLTEVQDDPIAPAPAIPRPADALTPNPLFLHTPPLYRIQDCNQGGGAFPPFCSRSFGCMFPLFGGRSTPSLHLPTSSFLTKRPGQTWWENAVQK